MHIVSVKLTWSEVFLDSNVLNVLQKTTHLLLANTNNSSNVQLLFNPSLTQQHTQLLV